APRLGNLKLLAQRQPHCTRCGTASQRVVCGCRQRRQPVIAQNDTSVGFTEFLVHRTAELAQPHDNSQKSEVPGRTAEHLEMFCGISLEPSTQGGNPTPDLPGPYLARGT